MEVPSLVIEIFCTVIIAYFALIFLTRGREKVNNYGKFRQIKPRSIYDEGAGQNSKLCIIKRLLI